jgi:hypothetical protein
MAALQAQPASSGELADQLGVTSRHIRRTISELILGKKIKAERDGRRVKYSVVAEEAAATAAASSSSITTAPGGSAVDRGHGIEDTSAIDRGHLAEFDVRTADIGHNSGHDCGHGGKETSKQRHRNAKRTGKSRGPAAIGPHSAPGSHAPLTCEDSGTNLCPQFFAGFERDMIQFVLVDRVFRDLLMSKTDRWTVRKVRGLTWIYPRSDLTLQVGKDTVVFYSAEPGDLTAIARWTRDTFPEYGDLASLVARIKHPQNLAAEELTVVIRHGPTIDAIRTMIAKSSKNGQFNLMHPSENIPGLKIYESNGTMRVEFIVHTHNAGASAIDMREELMRELPRIHHTPGLFWEFVQKYYSALHHPLIIDTGGHEFLQALGRMTEQFTDMMNTLAAKIPANTRQASLDDGRFKEAEDAIAEFQAELELEDIIRVFQRTLKLEEKATRVFLAAWAAWQRRNFRGRILKEDVASMLIRQGGGPPLTLAEIADAIGHLKAARLLQDDPRLEIKISPGAAALCRKMVASREGLQ